MFIATRDLLARAPAVRAACRRRRRIRLVPARRCRHRRSIRGRAGSRASARSLALAFWPGVRRSGRAADAHALGFRRPSSGASRSWSLIGFGGAGVWMATRPARAAASRRRGRRRARGPARAGAVLPGDAVLVALRSEGLDVGAAGRRDDQADRGSNRRRCRRSTRCSSCC